MPHDARRGARRMILDLFAGPGGWDEGARMLAFSATCPCAGLPWHHIAHSMRPAADPILEEFPWLDAA